YSVTLYKPKNDVVVNIKYYAINSPEITRFNNQIQDCVQSDKCGEDTIHQIMQGFQKFMNSTPREELSFGYLLDTVDNVAKSLTL
ncbi:hypothetical protein J7L13_02045, partial [bacterium]|nr:hypothetical protein [bacterium]